MSGWLAFAALVTAVATIQALVCAGIIAALFPIMRSRLVAAAMAGRTWLLVLVAALPLLTSAALVGATIVPSFLDGDHCLAHIDHALHLCLHHLPSIAPTFTVAAVVAVGAGLAMSALWRAAKLMVSGREEARSLASIARARDGVRWIESRLPLALTAGLLRPRVYVSSGLENGLDDVELQAAIEHERCHARERHALLKLLAMVVAMFHTAGTRRELMALVELACERRADEHAATVVDRLCVASALVHTHRLARFQANVALAFAERHLDQRVRALLEQPAPRSPRRWSTALITICIATVALANHELHHAVEHMLALLV